MSHLSNLTSSRSAMMLEDIGLIRWGEGEEASNDCRRDDR